MYVKAFCVPAALPLMGK